jgi:hypothetical protein
MARGRQPVSTERSSVESDAVEQGAFNFVEAERVPPGRKYSEFFVPPPEALQISFPRSAVIAGSLGAGKTMLLRYVEEVTTDATPVRVNLVTTLSTRTARTSPLPLMAEDSGEITRWGDLEQTKAAALVGVRIATRLARASIPVDESLKELLPGQVSNGLDLRDADALRRARSALTRLKLDAYEDCPEPSETLREFIELQTHVAPKPLLLLFDRAENIQSALLVPVLALLEKSEGYRALVTMRPGTRAVTLNNRVVAGDDYDLIHLGHRPRSDDWAEFSREVVRKQIRDYDARVPTDATASVNAQTRPPVPKDELSLEMQQIRVDAGFSALPVGAKATERVGPALLTPAEKEQYVAYVKSTEPLLEVGTNGSPLNALRDRGDVASVWFAGGVTKPEFHVNFTTDRTVNSMNEVAASVREKVPNLPEVEHQLGYTKKALLHAVDQVDQDLRLRGTERARSTIGQIEAEHGVSIVGSSWGGPSAGVSLTVIAADLKVASARARRPVETIGRGRAIGLDPLTDGVPLRLVEGEPGRPTQLTSVTRRTGEGTLARGGKR